jgi:GNAT superfamily N-acetyltransferase
VVLFFPEELTELVAEAGARGERIAWDLVMEFRGPAGPDDGRVEEVHEFDDRFWAGHRTSAGHFDIPETDIVSELQAIERDLMLPAGKRWFVVREGGEPVAFASLLILERVGFVDHVVTFPAARRRGHARELARRVLTEAHAAGAERTYLLAEPDGIAAPLYERLGFRRVSHLASWLGPATRTTSTTPHRSS